MKILIVGSDDIAAIENHYVKHIREAGINVHHFTAETIFNRYYNKSILNKILFKTGLSPVYKKINRLLHKEVRNFNPDIVWIFKGMQIFPNELVKIKQQKIKLINYNPDNPFVFSGRGSGNRNVTNSIKLYDLHFTYDREVNEIIKKTYNLPASILPFGFEVGNQLYDMCTEQSEILKVCFLGNPDQHRAGFIIALAEKGIQLEVYGVNWKRFVTHKNVEIHGPVSGNDFWKTLRKYRVQLNLMRIHNKNSHNMRSFEVPGIGGIMVAPKTDDHMMFFEDKKEVFLFKDVNSCFLVLKEVLEMPKEKSDIIRESARKRSMKSGYDYKNRAMEALRVIGHLHD